MSGEKILLVDDEEDFVEALARRMRARGLQVETAPNGAVANETSVRTSVDPRNSRIGALTQE